jgi:hypothetical protein
MSDTGSGYKDVTKWDRRILYLIGQAFEPAV